jgi:hypothetical protein
MHSSRKSQRAIKRKADDLMKEVLHSEPPKQACFDGNYGEAVLESEKSETGEPDYQEFPFIYYDSDSSENSASEAEVEDDNQAFEVSLTAWANEFGISHVAVDKLLKLLSTLPGVPQLPKTARTLLVTPRSTMVVPMGEGKFAFFGLDEARHLIATQASESKPELQINIDGLPIHKSNKREFWPILGAVNDSSPFVIAVFFGEGKPPLGEFLSKLVSELKTIEETVHIKFICDAPARAFIKGVKGHSGYSSCDKCNAHGVHVGHVVFDELPGQPRTDESFRAREDEDHHVGDTPLTELGIDMVMDFPYDYMHLVCLGVMKRLILQWMQGALPNRLPSATVAAISDRLVALEPFFPTEFARKPRSLYEIKFWKATEFRSFLLFSGAVCLHSLLPVSWYSNFLLLNVAITVLTDPNLTTKKADYASQLLRMFVDSCRENFGPRMLVYNVHSLLHLGEDAKCHGPLDQFSAFRFENFMQTIKRKLRAKNKPLEQLCNRLMEEKACAASISTSSAQDQDIQLLHPHCAGPVPEGTTATQYLTLKTIRFQLSVSANDCHVVDKRRNHYRIVNIVGGVDSNEPTLICRRYLSKQSFYMYPVDSQKLNIFHLSNLSDQSVFCIPLSQVHAKCLGVPHNGGTVAIPLRM